MNQFDKLFFSKYVSDENEVILVCHRHIVLIIDTIIVWMFFGVLVPLFFYYNSYAVGNTLFPIWYFEAYLFGIYAILVYKVIDWYTDSWIITRQGVVDLEWSLFKKEVSYIEYRNIKGVEVDESGMWNRFFHKGSVTLFIEGDEDGFILEDAEYPDEVSGVIQEILDDMERTKKNAKKQEYELVLDALKDVVKNHLKEKKHQEEFLEEEFESDEPEYIREALEKKGTLDLRGAEREE